MTHRLNFYRYGPLVFLSFVSILGINHAYAQNSTSTKDEYSAFEEELSKAEAPAPKAKNTPLPTMETPKATEKQVAPTPSKSSLANAPAEDLFKKKEYAKVTALLWPQVDKLDRQGFLILARSHEALKESAEMIRVLNILIGKNDKDFEAHSLLGNAYLIGKKNREALESYKRSIELNPKYEPSYDGLVTLYKMRNPPNLYELRILYQDLIENIGPRPQYLRQLCEINTLDGVYEAGIKACNDAISKDPKNPDPYVNLGICQNGINDSAQALQTLKKASADFPNSEFAHYQYATMLETSKNYVDAMKQYKEGTDADNKSARSWLGLANSSFEIRKFELALIAYKNACKHDKTTSVAFRRATSTLRLQKNTQWIRSYEEASETCAL